MKKYFVFLAVSLFAIQFAKADHDMLTTDMGRLPQKAQELVRTHFAQEKLSYIKIEEEILSTDYEARFESGTEIEFTGSGEWKSIDCRYSAVPEAVMPANIVAYVKQNFPNVHITKIEKDGRYYEVELSNRLELYFDRNYNFVGIDD